MEVLYHTSSTALPFLPVTAVALRASTFAANDPTPIETKTTEILEVIDKQTHRVPELTHDEWQTLKPILHSHRCDFWRSLLYDRIVQQERIDELAWLISNNRSISRSVFYEYGKAKDETTLRQEVAETLLTISLIQKAAPPEDQIARRLVAGHLMRFPLPPEEALREAAARERATETRAALGQIESIAHTEMSQLREMRRRYIACKNYIFARSSYMIEYARDWGRSRALKDKDLRQHAIVGLLRAIERYAPSDAVAFRTVAGFYTRQSVQEGLSLRNLVTTPYPSRVTPHKVRAFIESKGTGVSLSEVGEKFQIDAVRASSYVSLSGGIRPISVKVKSDRTMPPSAPLEELETRKVIEKALSVLPERKRFVLQHYYGLNGCEPKSLAAIGEVLSVTKQAVQYVRDQALDDLRGYLGSEFAALER